MDAASKTASAAPASRPKSTSTAETEVFFHDPDSIINSNCSYHNGTDSETAVLATTLVEANGRSPGLDAVDPSPDHSHRLYVKGPFERRENHTDDERDEYEDERSKDEEEEEEGEAEDEDEDEIDEMEGDDDEEDKDGDDTADSEEEEEDIKWSKRMKNNGKLNGPSYNNNNTSSSLSFQKKPEWFTADTSIQFQKTSVEQDPALGFFYTPRTLSILCVMLLGLVYVALTPEVDDTVTNVKIGLLAVIGAFCVFGMLQFRDSLLLRPHPVLWRVVLSIGVVYQLFLVFLLFQNKHDARVFFQYIDPSLGVPLPEKSYGDQCELTYDNVVGQVFDEFVVAHAVGWFCKALILRDYTFCWILSVMFEVMEYSLAHQLNNFDECWWDHWILDVLLCNWLGMYLGVKTCEYFEMKQYSWQGLSDIPTLKGKMKRTMQQFTPRSWTKFEWDSTKSFKNYWSVIGILFIFLVCELNAFYLKTLLWIPPAHSINVTRILMYFMFGIPGVREAYQFLHDPTCKRIGPQAWLLLGSISTETLIIYKFGQGEFPNPAPQSVIYFWICFTTMLVLYPIYQFGIPAIQARRKLKSQ